jgi:hypothetical protein
MAKQKTSSSRRGSRRSGGVSRVAPSRSSAPQRWSIDQARAWADAHPWLIGCNYTPRTAINQLEMWQADTFDPQTIDEELGWAESLGFNSVRVFLHDLLWQHDRDGLLRRMERFLKLADRHGIGVMFVLFDSCWHPFPRLGPQPMPEPGVHNSGWVQSPGVAVMRDPARFEKLKGYVTGVIRHFRDDERIHCWDLWNEPDNPNTMSRGVRDIADKGPVVAPLLEKTFAWARSAKPSQPLTCGVWAGGAWGDDASLKPWERVQIEHSDLVSFHWYGDAASTEKVIAMLQRYERPLLCTEYMARGNDSRFEQILPVLKKHRVGAYNWGFVAGKTQTHYAWDSWQRPYGEEPPLWFHDIFRPSGKPYQAAEVKLIRKLTGAG